MLGLVTWAAYGFYNPKMRESSAQPIPVCLLSQPWDFLARKPSEHRFQTFQALTVCPSCVQTLAGPVLLQKPPSFPENKPGDRQALVHFQGLLIEPAGLSPARTEGAQLLELRAAALPAANAEHMPASHPCVGNKGLFPAWRI